MANPIPNPNPNQRLQVSHLDCRHQLGLVGSLRGAWGMAMNAWACPMAMSARSMAMSAWPCPSTTCALRLSLTGPTLPDRPYGGVPLSAWAFPTTCALHPWPATSLAGPPRTPHPPSWTDRRYGGVPLTLKRAGVAAVATVQVATVRGTLQGATVRGTHGATVACGSRSGRRAREGARRRRGRPPWRSSACCPAAPSGSD